MRGRPTLLDAAPGQVVSIQGGSDSSEKNSTISKNKIKPFKGKYLDFRFLASFSRPEHLKPLPPIIQKCLYCINKLFTDSRYPKRYAFLKLFNKANPSGKRKKPVRLQHIKIVLECLISSLDLKTLYCGKPTSIGFKNRSLKEIACFTGLQYWTVQRCIQDLVKMGLLKATRLCKRVGDDKYIGYASIREFEPLFYKFFKVRFKAKQDSQEKTKQEDKPIKIDNHEEINIALTQDENLSAFLEFD